MSIFVSLLVLAVTSTWFVFFKRKLPFTISNEEPKSKFVGYNIPEGTSRPILFLRLSIATLKSLKFPNPAIEMKSDHILTFERIFRIDNSNRAFIVWDDQGYYANQSIREQTSKAKIIFASRAALVSLPFVALLERLSHLIMNLCLFCAYIGGLAWFLTRARITALVHKKEIKSCPDFEQKKSSYFEYVEGLLYTDMPWPAETCYVVLKALEGFHFRKCLELFPPERPNCEFGIDTGIVSDFHLKAMTSVDVGCEVLEQVHCFSKKYKKIERGENCYIENNTFANNSFNNIYLIHIVDHIPEIDKAFEQLQRILKPGGKVYFSGLSHDFGGRYLEDFCAGGNVHNNQPLSWYKKLAERHDFEVAYASYFQSQINSQIFKYLYPFANRTQAWPFIRAIYRRSKKFRKFYEILMKSLLPLIILDERFVRDTGVGLNFMMVIEKR